MAKCKKLLFLALSGPANMRFEDLCALAECYGFVFRKSGGTSHRVYKRQGYAPILCLQSVEGKAKSYQVKDLLDKLRELNEIEE
jgi:hypothetical protein